MGRTTFSGPIRSGSPLTPATNNIGDVELVQRGVATGAGSAATISFTLPANSTITGFVPLVTTAFSSGSNLNLGLGRAGATAAYGSASGIGTVGRKTTFSQSAAQIASGSNIGTDTTVVVTVLGSNLGAAGAYNGLLYYVQGS